MSTAVATIGIRGTGMYLESDHEQNYICTCYGTADLATNADNQSKETVITEHHDAPRYILAKAVSGKNIIPAPVINHTDDELELIETLVGYSVPFSFSVDYGSARKSKY